jgi:hypothetical protein
LHVDAVSANPGTNMMFDLAIGLDHGGEVDCGEGAGAYKLIGMIGARQAVRSWHSTCNSHEAVGDG